MLGLLESISFSTVLEGSAEVPGFSQMLGVMQYAARPAAELCLVCWCVIPGCHRFEFRGAARGRAAHFGLCAYRLAHDNVIR